MTSDDDEPFDEAWSDEDSPSVGDNLTAAQVFRQLAWFWVAVLLLAIITGLVVRVL